MSEVLKTHRTPDWQPEEQDVPEAVDLSLTVTDPELVSELTAYPDGRARHEFAMTALRIGILALKQAQGRLDADTIRNEGERLMSELDRHLSEHQKTVEMQVANTLKEYFDPKSGRFTERVERLIKKDGELEEVLHRQIGLEDSELGKTLASHFGETSPLMKLLSPDESKGVLRSLGDTLDNALKAQREGILREFSLDHKESALSRLVRELTERHGKLTRDLQGSVKEVVGEFSLDNEDSALSRLVRRVEQAQKQISSEFSLDEESSALARMKRELLDVLEAQRKVSADFQEEVKSALSAMTARKEEAQRSTTHGIDFESQVFQFLQTECQKANDLADHAGNTTGLIKNCKVGDIVIELGPESAAAGEKIVVEAKESASYDLPKARDEIEIGRKNRGASVGLFVFSERTAPEGLQSLTRYGNDVFASWDADDPASDVFLWAALSLARALCTRTVAQREAQEADFESIERAIREIEKQAGGLDEITRLTTTIQGNSDKILNRARIMQRALSQQVETLNEKIEDLKTVLKSGDSAS